MSDADDLMKGASKLFGKLGGALRQAGSQVKDTAKQVTGLGRGDVKLEIPQPRAHPGGTITGKVILALPEPVEAKRLIVTLRARQKVATISNSGGTKSVGTSHADVYQFDRELSGAQKYTSGEHAFELDVHLLQRFLHMQDVWGAMRNQLGAIAHQRAQGGNLTIRAK